MDLVQYIWKSTFGYLHLKRNLDLVWQICFNTFGLVPKKQIHLSRFGLVKWVWQLDRFVSIEEAKDQLCFRTIKIKLEMVQIY